MRKFKYIDDVEDWLEKIEYQDFWTALAPYDIAIQCRNDCDRQIASGGVDEDMVLAVLKYTACQDLTKRHNLIARP